MKEITNPGAIELTGIQKIVLSTKDDDPMKHIRGIGAKGFTVPSGFFLLAPPDIDINKPWDYVVFWDLVAGQFKYIPKEAFLYAVPKWIEEVIYSPGEPEYIRPDHLGIALEKLTVAFRGTKIRLMEKEDIAVEAIGERIVSDARRRLICGELFQVLPAATEAPHQAVHDQMFMDILGSGVVIEGEAMKLSSDKVKIMLSGAKIVELDYGETAAHGLCMADAETGYYYVAAGHVEANNAWEHLVFWDAETASVTRLSKEMVAFEAYKLKAPDGVQDVLGYFTSKQENVNCLEIVHVDLKTELLREAGLWVPNSTWISPSVG